MKQWHPILILEDLYQGTIDARCWNQVQPSGQHPNNKKACNVSVDPTLMLDGSTPAAQKALQKSGMTVKDIDLWECNEAFAAIPLKFQRDFDIPDDRLNCNGGAIAMGHPLGATGAILLGTLLAEMERKDYTTGMITISVQGGMGIASIIERV